MRLLLTLTAFALAGLATCEWLLALDGRQFDRVFHSASLGEDDPNRKDLVIESAAVFPGLVIQGEKDKNHWDGYYDIPPAERDVSDHYPLVVTFSFM